jgi:transposase InsO family protein
LKIKNIRSDNSSEFINTNVEEFLDEEGIKHKFSAPCTPQLNGIVERKNRTLIEAARIMLDEYKTPDIFWTEAINTTCHAINRARHPTRSSPVTNPRCTTLEFLGVSVSYLTRKPKA